MVENGRFEPTLPPFDAPVGMISECRRDFWHQKTRVPGLSYGVVCVILSVAVFVQLRLVTDRQTDGQTRDDSLYRASIARAVKKL